MIEDGRFHARLIAGSAFGATSPLATASDTLSADVELAAGASFAVEPSVTERALYTIAGEIEVAGQTFPLLPKENTKPQRARGGVLYP